jgi:hypothetical protein
VPKYAVVLNSLVENVILADTAPTIAGRTVVLLSANQAVGTGDGYNGSVFTPRTPTPREVAASNASGNLRALNAVLRQWSTEAQSVSGAAGAPTPANLRQLYARFGLLCDGMADVLLVVNADQ